MLNITDKNICHDCHVKADIKAPLQAEITDIIAITGSDNPKFKHFINLFVHYISVQFLCKARNDTCIFSHQFNTGYCADYS